MIGGLHDRHLIASWVTKSQVKLAILLLITGGGAWSHNSLEAIEAEGDDGLVWRDQSADGTRWASISCTLLMSRV